MRYTLRDILQIILVVILIVPLIILATQQPNCNPILNKILFFESILAIILVTVDSYNWSADVRIKNTDIPSRSRFLLYSASVYLSFLFAFSLVYFCLSNMGYPLKGDCGNGPFHDYPNCLYFSIITGSTVGFGDISPDKGIQKIIVGIQAVLVPIMLMFLISAIPDANHKVVESEEKSPFQ